jgi:hypothetical protein
MINGIVGDFHDSCFTSICKFETWFNVPSLRKAIAQTFYNAYLAHGNIDYMSK